MADKPMKISFTLQPSDVAHFRRLLKEAKSVASGVARPAVIEKVRELIGEVRGTKQVPGFVLEAIDTLEDLLQMLEDEDYALPKPEGGRALAALTYFANPADLIPDSIPGLGFLDDAIMIKIVEGEFKDELWGYRKFRKFREGAEQRPWTSVASRRLPERLVAQRKEIRERIKKRKAGAGRLVW